MVDSVECFWMEPTRFQRVSLRRWSTNRACASGYSYCYAQTPLTLIGLHEDQIDYWPASSIHWPEHCAYCYCAFQEHDSHQVLHEVLYNWEGTDIDLTISEAPTGAMWDACWLTSYPPAEDGLRLQVRLPNGSDWQIDRPPNKKEMSKGAAGARAWKRRGVAPKVTVTPCVVTNSWQGSLLDGCLISRKSPTEPAKVDFGLEDDDEDDED